MGALKWKQSGWIEGEWDSTPVWIHSFPLLFSLFNINTIYHSIFLNLYKSWKVIRVDTHNFSKQKRLLKAFYLMRARDLFMSNIKTFVCYFVSSSVESFIPHPWIHSCTYLCTNIHTSTRISASTMRERERGISFIKSNHNHIFSLNTSLALCLHH